VGVTESVTFGKEHSSIARDLNNLGYVYFSMGDKTKAKPYFQNAYDICIICSGFSRRYNI
jgi:hypothetical protein